METHHDEMAPLNPQRTAPDAAETGSWHPRHTARARNRKVAVFSVAAIAILAVIVTMIMFASISASRDSKDASAASSNHHHHKTGHHGKYSTVLSLSASPDIPSGCETTFLIFRHCDKYGPGTQDEQGNSHCSYVGFERNQFIANEIFGPGNRWPTPSLVYAYTTQRGNHLNFREVETVEPLADKYHLDVVISDDSSALADDYFDRLMSGEMCGKVALASWKHSLISKLCETLGNNMCPSDYPEDSFDQVWQLKFVYDPSNSPVITQAHLRHSNQPHKKHDATLSSRSGKKYDSPGQWYSYLAVTQQGFDPLQYSAKFGDYGAGNQQHPALSQHDTLQGTPVAGGWITSTQDEHEEI